MPARDEGKSAERSTYRAFHMVSTRWADNDQYGHINNAKFYEFVDSAVNAHLLIADALDESIGLVVDSGCRYTSSLAFPDVIEVGIKVDRVIIRTMVLSGAICGLMGYILTAGISHTLTTTIVDSRGFTAVMVSWMSKFNPFVMIAASLLLVTMDRGAGEISTAFSLNQSFADILTGIILFFIIATEFFITYKVTLRKSSKKEA